MDSLGSNHSIPSMSVSTGSQSSSVNSIQEVLDESSSELVMMQEDESTINSTSSLVHKKVRSPGALSPPPPPITPKASDRLCFPALASSGLWGRSVGGPPSS